MSSLEASGQISSPLDIFLYIPLRYDHAIGEHDDSPLENPFFLSAESSSNPGSLPTTQHCNLGIAELIQLVCRNEKRAASTIEVGNWMWRLPILLVDWEDRKSAISKSRPLTSGRQNDFSRTLLCAPRAPPVYSPGGLRQHGFSMVPPIQRTLRRDGLSMEPWRWCCQGAVDEDGRKMGHRWTARLVMRLRFVRVPCGRIKNRRALNLAVWEMGVPPGVLFNIAVAHDRGK